MSRVPVGVPAIPRGFAFTTPGRGSACAPIYTREKPKGDDIPDPLDGCIVLGVKTMIAEDDPTCTPLCVTLVMDADGNILVIDPRFPGEKQMLTGYTPAPIDTAKEKRFQGEVSGFCVAADDPGTAGDLAASVELPLLTAKGCLPAFPATIDDFCAAAYGKVPCGQRYCDPETDEIITVGGTDETDYVFVGGLETFGSALSDSAFAGFNKDATIKKGADAVMPYCLQAERVLSGADLKALEATEITAGEGGALSGFANLCAGEEITVTAPDGTESTTTVTEVTQTATGTVIQTAAPLVAGAVIKKATLLRTAETGK